ncbi:MAG TPA: transposase [Thiotrichaceae bacterium]|nr:transposase [Thiotrichaceae bacterium]
MLVTRVERHIVDMNQQLIDLSYASKNLYNCATFIMRQNFIKNHKIINYSTMDKIIKRDYPEVYKGLPAQSSQQVLRLVEKNWKSFLKANQEYKKNPDKFKGRPLLPKYKDKEKGLNIVIFTNQQCKLRDNQIHFPKKARLPELNTTVNNLQQVRIIPKYQHFVIEVVYKKEVSNDKLSHDNVLGIDLGLNNLATLVSNQPDINPMLINGKPLKSINQYFNKKKAKLMSFIGDKGTSHSIGRLSKKRHQKIDDYLHKASRNIIDYAVETNSGLIIVGENKNWKQEINIGKKNNQNFVSIPYDKFKAMIEYKAFDVGIDVVFTEESYTSKSSHLDNDPLPVYKKGESHCFTGKRVSRGLYRWSRGIINADLNGAIGIIKKVVPEALDLLIEIRNRGAGFAPFKVVNTF